MDRAIEGIAGNIEDEHVPPPLTTADPSLLLQLRHIFFIPTGGDVQDEAGSCLINM